MREPTRDYPSPNTIIQHTSTYQGLKAIVTAYEIIIPGHAKSFSERKKGTHATITDLGIWIERKGLVQ